MRYSFLREAGGAVKIRVSLQSLLVCALFIASLLAFGGCAGYQAGLQGDAQGRSIYVAPVQNETDFPELSGPATAAIRKALSTGSRWTLASAEQADTILRARIVGLDREVAAVQSDDVGRGQKFELVFRALVTLQPADQNLPPLFEDRLVVARRDVFSGESLIDAERQAGPVVANELGLRVSQAVSDTW